MSFLILSAAVALDQEHTVIVSFDSLLMLWISYVLYELTSIFIIKL